MVNRDFTLRFAFPEGAWTYRSATLWEAARLIRTTLLAVIGDVPEPKLQRVAGRHTLTVRRGPDGVSVTGPPERLVALYLTLTST